MFIIACAVDRATRKNPLASQCLPPYDRVQKPTIVKTKCILALHLIFSFLYTSFSSNFSTIGLGYTHFAISKFKRLTLVSVS